MKPIDRRTFLTGGAAAGALAGFPLPAAALVDLASSSSPSLERFNTTIDFRYAPLSSQCTICFPDDSAKTVLGEHGDLRYDFPDDRSAAIDQFGTIVEFTLAGMRRDLLKRQWLEDPATPIVHTLIERPTASVELIAFATRREGEGRVDNVLMEVRQKGQPVDVVPLVRIRSCKDYKVAKKTGIVTEILQEGRTSPWLLCIPQHLDEGQILWRLDEGGYLLNLEHGRAAGREPLRYFFRFPQEDKGQKIDTAIDPDQFLNETRNWWKHWQAFGGDVQWSIPARQGEFLIACARNIQQAQEMKKGRLVFEVGPTVYRGLWIVDGNFLLEAARYLGYDKQADEGLLTEWQAQLPNGQIVAGGGGEHWKDTAIAIFTLVRACELKQDWTMLRQLAPQVHSALDFLIALRDQARRGHSTNGPYGLLAPGFADGGIAGIRSEFTNTLWTLAGLKALVQANDKLNLPEFSKAEGFFLELRAEFTLAAKREMFHDPRGFNYLPMLTHDDPILKAADPWERPQPQVAQWALSQAICPGEVFAKDDPVVRGHIALMQACTQEDVPAETGWLWHDAVWNYNAAFVAEVYLWAGMKNWAHRTFTGFLNHASPLYAWREEQPLQNALVGDSWGDMPHNWASAECVRYLRHMLVLEDGQSLRLLDGLLASDLKLRQPFALENTPTRFGRVSIHAQPAGRSGWRLTFRREGSFAPSRVTIPSELIPEVPLVSVEGAAFKREARGSISVDPAAGKWTAVWGS